MRITIADERCSGCGNCAKVCPQKILRLDQKQVVVEDESRCMGCFGCEDECPKRQSGFFARLLGRRLKSSRHPHMQTPATWRLSAPDRPAWARPSAAHVRAWKRLSLNGYRTAS